MVTFPTRGQGPRLGLGGGSIGSLGDAEAFRLLDAACDLGVAFVDVARSYGDAEVRIGRWRTKRRRPAELFVATKGGYTNDEAWTGRAILRSIDESRERLCTESLDLFLLHSCNAALLDRTDVRDALSLARKEGRISMLGYSGDNEDLHGALDRASEVQLAVIEQSLSLLDGKARIHTLPRAIRAGLRVICKRALANAPWREALHREDEIAQRKRLERARIPDVGLPLDELFLRYAAFTPGVDVVLVGTTQPDNLARAARALEKGPLSDDVHVALAPALARCDDDSIL
jgi:aryl-alcohol dehydrogenase-like predicted oxidoreductase